MAEIADKQTVGLVNPLVKTETACTGEGLVAEVAAKEPPEGVLSLVDLETHLRGEASMAGIADKRLFYWMRFFVSEEGIPIGVRLRAELAAEGLAVSSAIVPRLTRLVIIRICCIDPGLLVVVGGPLQREEPRFGPDQGLWCCFRSLCLGA